MCKEKGEAEVAMDGRPVALQAGHHREDCQRKSKAGAGERGAEDCEQGEG